MDALCTHTRIHGKYHVMGGTCIAYAGMHGSTMIRDMASEVEDEWHLLIQRTGTLRVLALMLRLYADAIGIFMKGLLGPEVRAPSAL